MSIFNLISLLGGVALFLFGMMLMGDNLKNVAGNRLELVLYKLSGTPLKGILLGTGVTAVIQSSSATSVMVVGFVNSGMMKVNQAVSVIKGAIIGTSITGWIICLSSLGGNAVGWVEIFSTENISAAIAVTGIVLRMFSKVPVRRHVGEILLGFSVLMFGMSTMSGSVAVLRTNPEFVRLMTEFSRPVLGILAGILFTSILQSSSAAVGILQALSVTGAIRFDAAFALIMGIAIGAAVPVLLSAVGANREGKQVAISYLAVNIIGVTIVSILFYTWNRLFPLPFMGKIMNVFSIALLNTVFRIVDVLVTAPFPKAVEKLSSLPLRKKAETAAAEQEEPNLLEERFLKHPALAVEQSRLTINAMAEKTERNIMESLELLNLYTDHGYAETERLENLVDSYEDKLGTYLMQVTGPELNEAQKLSVSQYLHTITDLERISDHALNIAQSAREKHEKKISFSPEADREFQVLTSALRRILSLAITAFIDEDVDLAERIEPLEEHIDNLCDEMKIHHIKRMQEGSCTLEHGFVFNDLITNFERVADHCSNLGLAVMEFKNGDLQAHEYLHNLKHEQSDSFRQYLDEYESLFSL